MATLAKRKRTEIQTVVEKKYYKHDTCKEQTIFTEHHRQALQDLFDITLRYYQNSFDT
jgi:hypothetical protein